MKWFEKIRALRLISEVYPTLLHHDRSLSNITVCWLSPTQMVEIMLRFMPDCITAHMKRAHALYRYAYSNHCHIFSSLFHTVLSFFFLPFSRYYHTYKTIDERTDHFLYHWHLSNLRFFPLYARSIEHLKKPRIPKYLVFIFLLRGDRGRTTAMSDRKRAFSGEFSVRSISFQEYARGRWFVYHSIEDKMAYPCCNYKLELSLFALD